MILIKIHPASVTLKTPHVFSGEKKLFVYFVLNKSAAVPVYHRVDRVRGLFSSRPHWNSPTPSPAGECVPPPFGWGGGTLARGRVVGGVPIQTRGQTLWYSRYIYTFCFILYSNLLKLSSPPMLAKVTDCHFFGNIEHSAR
jgi:hypothetical protein